MLEAKDDLLAFTAFPHAHWRQIWSTNPLERTTKRSNAAPTSWVCSPTLKRSYASPDQC